MTRFCAHDFYCSTVVNSPRFSNECSETQQVFVSKKQTVCRQKMNICFMICENSESFDRLCLAMLSFSALTCCLMVRFHMQ